MKVALVSANIGGVDSKKEVLQQSVPHDLYYFTDDNIPFPLRNINARLKSKFLKIKMHKYIPDYDVFIWIDSSMQVTHTDFVKQMLENLGNNDIALIKHLDRGNPYEEIEHIQDRLTKNDEYLITRYKNEPWDEELDFYKTQGLPGDTQLYASGCFARYNNNKLNKACDDWWDGCIQFSNFDQAYLSYVTWKHNLKVNTDTKFTKGYHEVKDHVQLK